MIMRWLALVFVVFSLLALGGCNRPDDARENTQISSTPTSAPAINSASANDNSATETAPTDTLAASKDKEPGNRTSHGGKTAAGLYFANEKLGWVISGRDLFHTRDGGSSWTRISQFPNRNYVKIKFFDEKVGWVLQDNWQSKSRSNLVYKTIDGGRTWQKIIELPTPIYSIDLVSTRVGTVSGRWQPIKLTSDAGHSWQEISGVEGLNYIHFSTRQKGLAYGGAVWATEDSGQIWSQVVPYESVADLWDSVYISDSDALVVGSRRQLWRLSAGAWRQITSIPQAESDFTAFDFFDTNNGWIACTDRSIIRTKDAGVSWATVGVLPGIAKTIRFVSPNKGWALDDQGGLFSTHDGGEKWKSVAL
jgi:photosystem II stability/assembly factor-like uncharacterized protein